jgi:hypothetical protein
MDLLCLPNSRLGQAAPAAIQLALFMRFGREFARPHDWKFGGEPSAHAAGRAYGVEAMTLGDACDGSIGADLINVTTKLQQLKMRCTRNANSQTLAVAADVDKRELPAEEAIGRVRGLD